MPRCICIVFALYVLCLSSIYGLAAQTRLPDTGQTGDFTPSFGEDSDYSINPPLYKINGDGTVTDAVTGLMWQRSDGGEMTSAQAAAYADTCSLAGFVDWRLPTGHELFAILNHGASRPAMDINVFPATTAEYWWSSENRADNTALVWVANAGGGIGPHPISETISAGGTKRFHVRCVRGQAAPPAAGSYTDHGDGTVTDLRTGLMWRTTLTSDSLTWDAALQYCESMTYGGYSDWHLPNIKELQSLSSTAYVNPCFAPEIIATPKTLRIWSSTSLVNQPQRAWDLQTDVGIVSYSDKTVWLHALCVRGGTGVAVSNPDMATIPAGEFEMGDHFGFVDPSHPSDEIPIHTVRVDSFYLAKTLSTNAQYLAFLNAVLLDASIEVRNNIVYRKGDTNAYCFTNQYAAYYSISYDGKGFSMADSRANHPMVGVLWCGAAAYCNWLSAQEGFEECYNPVTWECDFLKNGYRLPTEAEWEWAGRGGHINPYLNYPFSNIIDVTKANLPESGDPYETGPLPNTTPVGFYDGMLKKKTDYNWPGATVTYQTSDGANGYGLYDMQGNVWEFVNDWYGQNYYTVSPYSNPRGPTSGFIMPDGKPYRGVRGGNWYNGLVVNGVNDGHSRVSNRNPSYYRGPGEANAPWHHTGFRIARNYNAGATSAPPLRSAVPDGFRLYQNYPNPFGGATLSGNPGTTIRFSVPRRMPVTLSVHDPLGRTVATLVDRTMDSGTYLLPFNASMLGSGVYYCTLRSGTTLSTIQMHFLK